jgi:hypothetical protein
MLEEGLRGEATSAVEWVAARSEADRLGAGESATVSPGEAVEAMAVADIWAVDIWEVVTGEAAVTAATTGAATIVAGAVGEVGVMLRAGAWDWALATGWATTTDGGGAGARPIIIPLPPTDTQLA